MAYRPPTWRDRAFNPGAALGALAKSNAQLTDAFQQGAATIDKVAQDNIDERTGALVAQLQGMSNDGSQEARDARAALIGSGSGLDFNRVNAANTVLNQGGIEQANFSKEFQQQKTQNELTNTAMRLRNDRLEEILTNKVNQGKADVGLTEAKEGSIIERTEGQNIDNTFNTQNNPLLLGQNQVKTKYAETNAQLDVNQKGANISNTQASTGLTNQKAKGQSLNNQYNLATIDARIGISNAQLDKAVLNNTISRDEYDIQKQSNTNSTMLNSNTDKFLINGNFESSKLIEFGLANKISFVDLNKYAEEVQGSATGIRDTKAAKAQQKAFQQKFNVAQLKYAQEVGQQAKASLSAAEIKRLDDVPVSEGFSERAAATHKDFWSWESDTETAQVVGMATDMVRRGVAESAVLSILEQKSLAVFTDEYDKVMAKYIGDVGKGLTGRKKDVRSSNKAIKDALQLITP